MHIDNEPSVPLQEDLAFPLRKPRRKESGKLRRLGILHLLFLIPATLILFGLVTKSTEVGFVGFITCLVVGVPLAAVVYILGASYSRLAQSAQGLRQMTAEEVLQDSLCSGSPFVLYLRNFDQEIAEQFSKPQSNILVWANADSVALRLVEEALLRNIAIPVVTLANPKDGGLLISGAHRFAHIPAGIEWIDLVRRLIKICSAVVVFVSKETKAISMELSTIEQQACQEKAIIVIDPRIGTGGTIVGCKLKREYSRFGHVEFLRTSPISLWEPRFRRALKGISGCKEIVRSHISYRLRLWADLWRVSGWQPSRPLFLLA